MAAHDWFWVVLLAYVVIREIRHRRARKNS